MVTTVQPIRVGTLKPPPGLKAQVNIGLSGDWEAAEIFSVFDHNRHQVPVHTSALNVIGPTGPATYGGTPTPYTVATKINDLIRQRQDTGYAQVTNTNEITLRGKIIRFCLEYDPKQVPWDSPPSCSHIVEASDLIYQPLFPNSLSGKPMSSTLDLHISHHYGVETALTIFPPDEPYEVDTFYIPQVMSSNLLGQATKVSTGSLTIASIAPFIQTLDKMFGLVELTIIISNTISTVAEKDMEVKALTSVLQKITTSVPVSNVSFRAYRPQVGYRTFMGFETSQNFDPQAFTDELNKLSQPGQIFEDFYTIDHPPSHYDQFPYAYAAYILPGTIKADPKNSKKGFISTAQNPKGYAFIVAQALLDLIDANQQQALRNHTRQRRRIFP